MDRATANPEGVQRLLRSQQSVSFRPHRRISGHGDDGRRFELRRNVVRAPQREPEVPPLASESVFGDGAVGNVALLVYLEDGLLVHVFKQVAEAVDDDLTSDIVCVVRKTAGISTSGLRTLPPLQRLFDGEDGMRSTLLALLPATAMLV